MKCPKCQAELPDDAKFCGVCGQSLKAERVCLQCGQVNPQDFKFCLQCGYALAELAPQPPAPTPPPMPTSFAGGRYQVKKFLGEGGKKKVYLAHDTVLDRDVAFALIKTKKLDELISGHYPFDKINKAIASMEKGGIIRNVIMF